MAWKRCVVMTSNQRWYIIVSKFSAHFEQNLVQQFRWIQQRKCVVLISRKLPKNKSAPKSINMIYTLPCSSTILTHSLRPCTRRAFITFIVYTPSPGTYLPLQYNKTIGVSFQYKMVIVYVSAFFRSNFNERSQS